VPSVDQRFYAVSGAPFDVGSIQTHATPISSTSGPVCGAPSTNYTSSPATDTVPVSDANSGVGADTILGWVSGANNSGVLTGLPTYPSIGAGFNPIDPSGSTGGSLTIPTAGGGTANGSFAEWNTTGTGVWFNQTTPSSNPSDAPTTSPAGFSITDASAASFTTPHSTQWGFYAENWLGFASLCQ
jgi:hypothetical protein